MQLSSLSIQNFRRLKDVSIELEPDTSIFVGANNSGKTSATQALQLFLKASKSRFSIYDFSESCWAEFLTVGDELLKDRTSSPAFPSIVLDLWFDVQESDLHRIIALLPNLSWSSSKIGIRLEFTPNNIEELKKSFFEAYDLADGTVKKAEAKKAEGTQEGIKIHHPWPKDFKDFITKRLNQEYTIKYSVLDFSQFENGKPKNKDYEPALLGKDGTGQECEKIINSLIRIDVLYAQRHLSDQESTGRSEDLSRRLSRFYDRNLEKHEEDFNAVSALAEAENQINDHLKTVFQPTLDNLNKMGYPGFSEPHLEIKSTLRPESILSQGAEVHYRLGDPGKKSGLESALTLPDRYNGLGFKNLIYMVVEVLDFQAQWLDREDAPLLHLIIIEEPEAHLHAQLQQVFIRQIWDTLRANTPNDGFFANQLVITTHSGHIIYESGFKPIRYFRREEKHQTQALNLSEFKPSEQEGENKGASLRFLQQYLKLTHCDLFFADAAVFVEGNVERLLLPLMIEKEAKKLKASYLSIIEVGGAFAHRFKELIDFLGLTALVITDLDSVEPKVTPKAEAEDDDTSSTKCLPSVKDAVTSNATLKSWLPKLTIIEELLNADKAQKIQQSQSSNAHIRVAYQTKEDITWNEKNEMIAARTLEEAFTLKNLTWCQHLERKHLKLRVQSADKLQLEEIVEKIHKKVSGNLVKTDFALNLLMEDPKDWQTPSYIAEGLQWLECQLHPVQSNEQEDKATEI